MLHWLQRNSVIDKTQAKRTTAGSTSAQKVQSRHSLRWCKIMSLVTKKTQWPLLLCLKYPKEKKKILKAGGVVVKVTNQKYTLKGFVSSNSLKHLLYRRVNILNMYNYTKVDVYVNWCGILTEKITWRTNFPISWALWAQFWERLRTCFLHPEQSSCPVDTGLPETWKNKKGNFKEGSFMKLIFTHFKQFIC